MYLSCNLHQSKIIQGNLFGLATLHWLKLPTFYIVFYRYHNWRGGLREIGSQEVAGKNTRQVVTLSYGPIDDVDSPKSSQISG